jgi:hypothetical protein
LHQGLDFHPIKVQVVQELKPRDLLTRKNLCQEMLTEMSHNEESVHDLWMSDKVHFHLDSFMNKQHFCYYSEESSRHRPQRPLLSDQLSVMYKFISRHYWSTFF